MQENQRAWNSDNHRIKETKRTTKWVGQCMERNYRKRATMRQQTMEAGLGAAGRMGGADLRGN